ncbi:MAG: hypothetical protein WA718_17125, partial [Terriglobales bacterium]
GRHVGLDFYDLLIEEALKFRLLSIDFTSEGFETGRKMTVSRFCNSQQVGQDCDGVLRHS